MHKKHTRREEYILKINVCTAKIKINKQKESKTLLRKINNTILSIYKFSARREQLHKMKYSKADLGHIINV